MKNATETKRRDRAERKAAYKVRARRYDIDAREMLEESTPSIDRAQTTIRRYTR